VAAAANETSLFKGIDRFTQRCRAKVELSRKFGQRQTFIRNYVQGHELRRAQSRSLKAIEIRSLDNLAQLHPCSDEPRCLLFQSRHFCIVYEPAVHSGSAFVCLSPRVERNSPAAACGMTARLLNKKRGSQRRVAKSRIGREAFTPIKW
jgi:hypothetical protein